MIQILGSIFIIVFGSLNHFMYDFLKHNKIGAILFSVNESTWEHMKLAIFPGLIWIIITSFLYKENNNFLFASFVSLYLETLLIPIFYYLSNLIFNNKSFIFDIGIFVVSIIIGQILFNIIINSNYIFSNLNNFALIGLTILIFSFFLFTFYPPHNFLFKDPITQKYGLDAHKCYNR